MNDDNFRNLGEVGQQTAQQAPGLLQGDVGRQLNRISPALRDALGPAVVQHIMNFGGGAGTRYPGSLSYMLGVQPFEANDSFRLNRDAWGRGFALGSSDMPHPTRPRP